MSGALAPGWTSALLDDIVDFQTEQLDPSAQPSEEFNYIGLEDVEQGTGRVVDRGLTPGKQIGSGKFSFQRGDVLYGKLRPYLRKVAVATSNGISSTDLLPLRPREGVDPRYLRDFLLSPLHTDYISPLMAGIRMPRLRSEDIRRMPVPLPPSAEQKRIVAKIEEVTARSRRAKRALDAVPPLLDQLRQSILAAAFRGDLTADWRAQNANVERADSLLARIRAERRERWEADHVAKLTAKGKAVDRVTMTSRYKEPDASQASDVGNIPEGWAWATIELAGDVLLGRRRAAEEYVDGEDGRVLQPYVRVANVKRDRLVLDDVFSMPFNPDELDLYRLLPGDIVLSEGQSPELVGQSAVYEGGYENLCIQATVHRFRAYEFATTSRFAQLLFLSHLHTGVFRRAASLTTNIAHLTSERLRPLPFPLPPLEEQALIVERARAALSSVARVEQWCGRITQDVASLNASVLAKAFRGELVPQDSNDAPASVLMESIRATRDSAASAGSGSRRRSRETERVTESPCEDDSGTEVSPIRLASAQASRQGLREVVEETLHDQVSAALWMVGPIQKDEAVRRVADYLCQAGYVQFERLRTDGALFGQVLDAIESAVKTGRLDRPKRGHVRACKTDAATYTADDWRHALVASLGPEPTGRDEAIRAAAEWARDNLGLEFTRLRGDGRIVGGLRSAINSAIRRGDVIRHDATHISRAGAVQPDLLLKGRSA